MSGKKLVNQIAFVNLLALFVTVFVFAADGVPADAPPAWLEGVINFVRALPYVGPVVVEILKWMGVISAVMTAISVCTITVLKIPQVIAKWAGASKLADQIQAISDKVLPYLKYLSMFNVQKK